jgi:hypothetical protein
MSMRHSRLPAVIPVALCALIGLSGCYYDEFREWRMRQNDQIGTEIPPPDAYCYRTLADVSCYARPDKQAAARRLQ